MCRFAKSLLSTRFRHDEWTWRHRLTGFHQSWKPLIDTMADAYLRWKYPDDPGIIPDETRCPPSQPPQSLSTLNDLVTITPSIPSNDPPLPKTPSATHSDMQAGGPTLSASADVEVSVIDIYTLSTSIKISCMEDQTTASTLAGLGYIGNAPFRPLVVISIKTLELYRIMRRRKPSFSVEAFVKVICDLYMACVFLIIYSPCSHRKKDPISSQVLPFVLGWI